MGKSLDLKPLYTVSGNVEHYSCDKNSKETFLRKIKNRSTHIWVFMCTI